MSSQSLDDLLEQLGGQEPQFLNRVRTKVYQYVRGTGKDCIAIAEEDAYGVGRPRTHHVGLDSYVKVMGCFLLKKPYNSHKLDSALTAPVAELVGDCYDEFLKDNAELISQHFLQQMMQDNHMLNLIMTEAVNRLAAKSASTIRGNMIHAMVEGVKHAAATKFGHSVTAHVSAGITTVASTAVAQKLGPIILKLFVVHFKVAIAHALSSAAFKAAAYAAIKHCVYIAASTAFLHVVAAKVGVAHATAYLHLVGLAILAGIVAHAALTLPHELGEKVSESVVTALSKEFRQMNRMNMEKIKSEIFGTDEWASTMGGEIAKSSAVEEAMKHFGDELARGAEQESSWLHGIIKFWSL